MSFGAESLWGPFLGGLGSAVLLLAALFHGFGKRPTLLPAAPGPVGAPPGWWERISVHLIFYGVWGVGFGAIVWRGAPRNMIDVRFAFERGWPVVEWTEWIYLSVYFVPLFMPWLKSSRADLRRYALNLWWLLLLSGLLFLLLPLGAPPRLVTPHSLAGRILQGETGRPDFAAASLPSFHLIWALLCADLVARRGRRWAVVGWSWAAAVAVACVANGAHAILDLVAAIALYLLVAGPRAPLRGTLTAIETRLLGGRGIKPPPLSSNRTAGPA